MMVWNSVGYNVTYGQSLSMGWSVPVASGKTGHIGYKDWYHCNDFTCHTRSVSYPWGEVSVVYGSGQARQWFKCAFYSYES